MPILCKIQLDAEGYKKELDEVLKLTARAQAEVASRTDTAAQEIGASADKAAKDVEAAADRADKAAQKAASSVSKMKVAKPVDLERDALKNAVSGMDKEISSSRASGFVDKIKDSFSGLNQEIVSTGSTLKQAMGKVLGFGSQIAIIAAGIASVIKIVKTLAVDLPLQKMKDRAEAAAASFESMKEASASAEEYRRKTDAAAKALSEFTTKDKLSNLEKEKAVRLIKEMSQGYGNLGISINEATGKVEGYTAAMVKKLQADKENRQRENAAKLNAVQSAIAQYDQMIEDTPLIFQDQVPAMQQERARLWKERDALNQERFDLRNSDPVGDYLADHAADLGRQERDIKKSEKQFAQSREFAGMSREEKGDALRKRIAEEQGKLDSLGDTLAYNEHIASQTGSTPTGKAKVLDAQEKVFATREKILETRQQLEEYRKLLDDLDAEEQRRRDEENDAFAAGLSPLERANLLRGNLAAAEKKQSGYREELAGLEGPGYHGAADEERKVALREKIAESQERILDLTKRISEAEAEAVRVEQEAQDRVNSFLDAQSHELEVARLEAAAEYEKADALRLQHDLQAQNLSLSQEELEKAKQIAKERNAASLQSNLSDQSADLLGNIKRKIGLDEEADIEKAIREAEKINRGKLSPEQEDYVTRLTKLSRAVSGKEENPLDYNPDLSIRTNELTARGGFSSGAVVPGPEQVNKKILTEIQQYKTLLKTFHETVKEGLST
jgi:hypothetical protein